MSSGITRQSIKRRLLVLQLAAVAIVWLAAAAYSYFDAGHEVNELLDAHLAQSAALLVVQGQNLEEIDIEHAPQLHRYGRRVAFQVWEDGKTLRVHSANAPSERLSPKDDGFSDAVVGSRRWRVFSTWDPAHRVLVQVGEQIEARDHIAAAIAGNLLKPLLFALAVLGALTYWSVRRGLRPLGLLNREIEQRDPENLKPVAVDDCPTEVAPLVAGLNRLFARVAESIEGERRFTADAAHELRTPIAALRMQAQVAEGASDEAERRRALGNVIAGCDRATHLVEQLLTLARLDPASPTFAPGKCDLHAVARRAVADVAPDALAKEIEIEVADGGPVPVRGDEALLGILVRNLVDNAVRYSAPRTTVRVSAERDARGGGAVLSVSDEGPGLPADEMQKLGTRFYRALGTGEAGSGLGLSIVKRIAGLHDAELRFEIPDTGPGMHVSVSFRGR